MVVLDIILDIVAMPLPKFFRYRMGHVSYSFSRGFKALTERVEPETTFGRFTHFYFSIAHIYLSAYLRVSVI
jgi:hypothetical protein